MIEGTKPLPSQWKYVDTKANPADDVSRGLSTEAIVQSNRWAKGPELLWLDEERLPKTPIAVSEEIQKEPTGTELRATFATHTSATSFNIMKVFQQFSSWYALKKFVAWMLGLKERLRRAAAKRKQGQELQFPKEKKTSPIDVDELRDAERAIIKLVQDQTFKEKLLSLRSSRKEIKKSSSIAKLDPTPIEGILRVGGRLQKSPIDQEAKHPTILPKDHHVLDLIIRHYHLVSGPSGIEHTLSLIQQKYWIIKARVSLRCILSSCFDCRKRNASVGQQKMASLPQDRVSPSEPPFSHVGVDCFGPFNVCRGRGTAKRYGVLFTCLSIRAIHIEVVHSLDTDSFINALRQFIASQGVSHCT